MASNFPVSLDTLPNPTPTSRTNAPSLSHAVQHSAANDAIRQIQGVIGITGQTDVNSLLFKINTLLGRTPTTETPIGVVDGINTTFAVSNSIFGDPLVFSEQGSVYTVQTFVVQTSQQNQFTLNVAPPIGSLLTVFYTAQLQ